MTPTLFLVLALLLPASGARAQFCPLGQTERRIVTCKPDTTMEQCRARALTAGCDVVRELPLIHAVVIEIPQERIYFAEARLNAAPDVASVEDDAKVSWIKSLPDSFGAPSGLADLQKQLDALKRSPAAAPSDAGSSEIPWGVARVGAPAEWAKTEGRGAKVGVIDTGIDATHPDLQGQVAGGVNIVDPSHPDAWADDMGHGTHVAGTIAAKRDGKGVVGVAPEASLYAIKVLDKNGNGNYDDVIAGIQWAMDHGIKILNMSLGADQGTDALHAAVIAARKAGVTIVAAAGNSGGAVGYPGAYPEVVSVAASDSANHVAPFSSRGPEVDFIAPGVDIRSTKMGGGYTTMSGTSMATPHVAGLAALAWSLGDRTPDAIVAALKGAAHPIAGLTPDLEGSGMVLAGDLGGGAGLLGGPTYAMASAR
ncbi:MAG: S8 family peptidase [Elusimicrobia bacterium]|nr:S8 family peptidase [Elusimicrobiota bacterium]